MTDETTRYQVNELIRGHMNQRSNIDKLFSHINELNRRIAELEAAQERHIEWHRKIQPVDKAAGRSA